MADPKYANLPGIAYDQADVYETSDLPEAEQLPIPDREESDCVEILHTNTNEAFDKFKNKYISSNRVDFSDRVSHKSRSGYDVPYGEWEILTGGTKETPIQKFERLKHETKDLIEEIGQLKERSGSREEDKSAVEILSQIEELGKQLDSFSLEKSLGTELIETLSDPQASYLRQLMSRIEVFKQQRKELGEERVAGIEDRAILESGVLKYQMMYYPERARLQELGRIAQLEQRIGRLENIIGMNDEKLLTFSQSLKCDGIIEAVKQLKAKSSLLDTSHLDIVENRLSVILNKMDSISQKKSALPQNSENDQKITEMYEIVKKVESLSDLIPKTIDRLSVLNAIHKQAADFSKSLNQLELLQSQISASLESNQSLLKGVEDSFNLNLETIKKNMTSLDERIRKLRG